MAVFGFFKAIVFIISVGMLEMFSRLTCINLYTLVLCLFHVLVPSVYPALAQCGNLTLKLNSGVKSEGKFLLSSEKPTRIQCKCADGLQAAQWVFHNGTEVLPRDTYESGTHFRIKNKGTILTIPRTTPSFESVGVYRCKSTSNTSNASIDVIVTGQ